MMPFNTEREETKHFLDHQTLRFNRPDFISSDPIQVPHRFSRKEDIEIAAFLTATIAWGQRKSIIANAIRLMGFMDNMPYDFLVEADPEDWERTAKFVHRTFNGSDCLFFLHSLKNIYTQHQGLEAVFTAGYQLDNTVFAALKHFRAVFLSIPHEARVEKHVSSVAANSSAKRLNMFLRWMVRNDENEVDFGLWKNIPTSALMLPLDVHSGNVSRSLGLLKRQQNDWKAVEEITAVLRSFDPVDPVKYDYALFGIGAFKDTGVLASVPGL
ncbi:MAG TPA: TIGR02757 family protein [Paludibacter sp.]|nr:TIGR02757 family protein [Paludibacter sp.]